MRGVGGTLSPTRAARRKAPSSCCSYSAAPALSLCMSIAFLVFMATHLGGTRDSKVAHSQPTEVSTARKLSGEGVVLRRGYERARRGEGGRKMDLEEELEKDLHAGEPLHERGERERGKRSRTRGGEESFGQPNEVLQSEWMPAQEAKKGAAEGGVKKFSAQQGGEYVIDLGESEWERIQREGGTGGGTSKGGHSEPEIDGEGLRGVEIQGAFSKDKVGKMTKGEVEVNTPHGQGGGFGVQVDKGSSRETAKTNLEYESNSFKVKGALSPMQKAKWSSAGDIGAESIELDNLGQANQRLAWDTTGQHEKEKRFPAAEDSDWPDQVPGAVTVKVEDVGQANLLDSPKSAGSQMYPAQRADSGSRDARQTDRAQVKPPVTEDKDEFETQTSEGSGHSDQVHERPLLWPRDKPTKQVLMVKNFFQHNEIESSGHVLDDEGSSRRMGNDKPSDEDLALAVLPEFGVLSVDSLSARANNLSEADGSLQNVLNRTSNTEAPHLSVIKADNSFQKQERLINGRLEDVTYRQALLRSFQEGLDCMAPGLELFDGNASLMTGASAYGRCAFVGNSGMMRAAERGEEIDGHDVILRSNQAPTKGYEEFVGSKTTFRFLNKKWAVVYASAKQGRGILLPQEDPGTVLIASRSEEPEYSRLVQAVGETRPDVTAVHLSGGVRRCAHVALQSARQAANAHGIEYEGGDVPSTGFLAIFFLLQACESVDVYGLSMEPSDGHVAPSWPYHYFEHYVDSENLRAHPHHSFEMEGDLVRAFAVERPARLRVTEAHAKEPE